MVTTKNTGDGKPSKKELTVEEVAQKLEDHLRNAPIHPVMRRYKTNDTTVEKLGELLQTNPNGLLALRDELVGLLASWEKQGREGDRTFYLESWNGNVSFDTDRIGRGSIFIPNLCVSIFGGIQPDKLRALLELMAEALANDGTIQRFQLLVYPDAVQWEWRDRIIDKQARDRAYILFEKLSDFDPVVWGASEADDFNKFPYFSFSEEAQEIFINWSSALHTTKIPKEENPFIAQHLTKYDKLFPSLALIFHLIACADSGAYGPISAQAATMAWHWCEYLESHARRCYALLADEGLRAAQNLADKISKGKLEQGFTARDIQRHQWSSLKSPESVQSALDWLEDSHWIRGKINAAGPKGGKPTTTYQINPKIKQEMQHADQ